MGCLNTIWIGLSTPTATPVKAEMSIVMPGCAYFSAGANDLSNTLGYWDRPSL